MPLCRKPFGPVDEKYLPELKALAQQLMQERGEVVFPSLAPTGRGGNKRICTLQFSYQSVWASPTAGDSQ